MMVLMIVITVVAGYLLGNLNGAVLMSHKLGDDVRNHGSGNAGLTNFVRNYGASRSIVVIAVDGGKAVVACVLGGLLLMNYLNFPAGAAIGGAAVMLGHVFPAFLKFKGGKGILSSLFIGLVVDWRVALLGLAIFAIFYAISGYVSLGSIMGIVTYAVCFFLFDGDNLVLVCCTTGMCALAMFMHRKNIVRLLKGEEKKTNLFKKKAG